MNKKRGAVNLLLLGCNGMSATSDDAEHHP